MSQELKRLNKYLSEAGYCSRRAADRLIEAGRVTINDVIPEMGTKVASEDVVKVDGEIIGERKQDFVYLAFNKPVGIVCTTDTRVEKDNIIDYLNYPKRIFPIGRLDKPSEGLILLTDDGDIVIERMSGGIYLEDLGKRTKECVVKKIDKFTFSIILTQGLNRQIRRMCEYLNYEVQTLKRVRIMNIKLDLSLGQYRELTKEEFKELNTLISDSIKTYEPKTIDRSNKF